MPVQPNIIFILIIDKSLLQVIRLIKAALSRIHLSAIYTSSIALASGLELSALIATWVFDLL
jgi:hypothetical protein